MPRDVAEIEAARATCVLARNRGYSWKSLRLAFEGYPELLARIPDTPGAVDSLPLGYATVVPHPKGGFARQGRYRVPPNEVRPCL